MNKNLLLCILFSLLLVSCGHQNNGGMNVATYNIRIINKQDSIDGNGWTQRLPHIADVIKFHGFDIFGTQEGLRPALNDLKSSLQGYDYIGVGCDDGADAGGNNAIFYNTDKFDLLDNGTFWLSETPDSISFGWDAAYRRVCTWGKFRHRESGLRFIYYNLHLDHIGTVAQTESAKLILRKIKEQPEPLPVILSGDFNVDQNSESYRLINQSGVLLDAYDTAPLRYINTSTFNNYDPHGSFLTPSGDFQRIDHIFFSPDFTVKKYGVLTDTYRTQNTDSTIISRVPSDHYPVMVTVEL
ncbi:MAG: endonuclease/exonuclease/phosphatase family protein [Muribaculaceae bacterium]|nr:endonuclease/exonuclease/phosphatase family protein [Muribaculaceae bacterium]